ncbi:MAG: DoxX family protein [Pedobacter sp.]|jgi:putative oxidoreductase|nr:DoxX family protein [Pedobacter sp.]
MNVALLILRVVIGCFMLVHGLPKLHTLVDGGTIKFGDPIGVGVIPSLILAVFAEVICSILLIVGFGTRLAVLPLMTTMLVAIFVVHAPDGFDKKELAAHFLLVYFFLLLSGSGKYSVDYLISTRLNRRRRRR